MGFGCSFSLVEVDCIDFVKTRLWKRILRGIIGLVLAKSIDFFFDYITPKYANFGEIFIIANCFPRFI